jgi:predicted NBD/HSP70 family sugar kinase
MELKSLLADRSLDTPTGRIVRVLSERGTLSAAQISRLTGLAKSTVSTTLAELRRTEMVVEVGSEPSSGVGRPATALTLNPKAGRCIGILVGQTEIQMIVADVAHNVLSDRSVELEPEYSPARGADVVRDLIQSEGSRWTMQSLLGVGIAAGGPVNPISGRMLRAGGMPSWAGVDMRELFGSLFPDVPIFCDNESNCSAIAEMTWGAAQGHEDFIVYTLDLGVGGAIVSGGKALRGVAGGAGEFGHVVLDPDGPPCRCGNRGCVEVFASFREPLAEAERHFGRSMRIAEVAELAKAGDAFCRDLVERAGRIGGHGLGIIGSVLNPPLVVVSGRLALAGDILIRPLTESFEHHTLIKRGDVPDETRTIIRASQFTDNGACLGAVGMVLRHHGQLHSQRLPVL